MKMQFVYNLFILFVRIYMTTKYKNMLIISGQIL